MAPRRVVVDGSNIATEGRTLPSLKQLNEAVMAFLGEFPDSEVTVVVDASFGHRIDPSEMAEFEAAEAAGELVSPPAGAIGRGDAFLLRIAGKVGAVVLSNDSFQEFHGDHDWLFTEGRLVGGKPVPGVGWIFTPRSPVRGVKSRKAVKEAKGKAKADAEGSGEALGPMPVPSKPPPRGGAKGGEKGEKAGKTAAGKATAGKTAAGRTAAGRTAAGKTDKTAAGKADKAAGKADKAAGRAEKAGKGQRDKADLAVLRAIAVATEESIDVQKAGRKRRRKKRTERPAEPVNDPLPFITFIATHKLGATVEGVVETFTSHGAFVVADGARCYIPIVALGDPPPRAAREVLQRGEVRPFIVQALDPQRRGIELALPEFARVSGAPTKETIEAEIAGEAEMLAEPVAPAPAAAPAKKKAAAAVRKPAKKPAAPAATKKAPAKKAANAAAEVNKARVKKAAPAKKTASAAKPAKQATTKAAAPVKKAAVKKAAVKKAAVKKAPAKQAAAKKAKAAVKKAAERKPSS